MKEQVTIVTHRNPDPDALCSVWLLKRFGGKRYHEAKVVFVPHGTTLENSPVDSTDMVVHVDTGGGQFDHHNTDAYICAAMLVYKSLPVQDEILERILTYINAIDHFDDVEWHEPISDLYDFTLSEMLGGLRLKVQSDAELLDVALLCFDGVYASLKTKYQAIESVTEYGLEIDSVYGKMLAIQTFNDDVIRTALKMGYVLVLRRDPQKKYVRIKAHPRSALDLTYLYQKLQALDPQATWFLHADKKQLLNGSSSDAERVVTELEFEELVELLREL